MASERDEVFKHALANAVEHDGKADVNAVVKKLLAEHPEWKVRIGALIPLVREVVREVNSMGLERQKGELEKLGGAVLQKREERKGLPPLPRADEFELIVTRFAPNPNGPLHIGHARAAVLSHEYARAYQGKFVLRFEDTNPENVLPEMYESIKKDLHWLNLSWDEEYVQSDRLPIYYSYAEKLLKEGKAYVCTCPPERFRELRDQMKACPCRDLLASENLQRWSQMLAGDFEPGSSVFRVKTDLDHPNPAVRDWPGFRVVRAPHPRVGRRYHVWPLYNFAVSVDDHEMGITHIFRGKEHEGNEQRQRFLYQLLGWEYPVAIQYGRLRIPGAALSKTEIVQAVRDKRLSGFDDVRLATLAALRRRGFLPETVKKVVEEVGVTLVDSFLSWETLYAHNRKLVDKRALRLFFVPDPVELVVENAPPINEVRLRNHPNDPEAGERIVLIERREKEARFFVPASDIKKVEEGDIIRLKDLMNVKITFKREAVKADFFGLGVVDVPKVQWVSKGAMDMEVLMPDNSVVGGLVEPSAASFSDGAIVQLERFGFVRIERFGPKILAVFGHA